MSARWIAFRSAPLAFLLFFAVAGFAQGQTLLVTPAEVKLEGNFARVQLLVTAADASGMVNERSEDLTSGAKFDSSDAKIVSVNERGMLLAVADGQAKITITAIPDKPGNAARVFKAIGEANVNIDMIIQNTSREGEARISFTLHKNDLKKATAALEAVKRSIGENVEISAVDGIAKVSAVGIGMRSHSGVAGTLFAALGEAGINIDMISTSEIKIAVVVDEKDQENAVRTVHKAFRLHEVV